MKRVILFLATNLLVIVTLSTVIHLLGLDRYLTAHGLNYSALAVFCFIWGMGGSFISLALSRIIAKTAMGVRIIDPKTAAGQEKFLVDIVHNLAKKAQLPVMPEVGIYDSEELNAFATGPSKRRALVAVSSGLLQSMTATEIEGVLSHEITHIANGDMVTMTLLQGVINAFALFLSRIIAYAISISRGEDREEAASSTLFFVLTMVFDILFTLLGSLVVAAFSRWREYRADRGGAQLSSPGKMVQALEKLKLNLLQGEDNRAPSLAALKISHQGGWLQIFASHPPLEQRINRLKNLS